MDRREFLKLAGFAAGSAALQGGCLGPAAWRGSSRPRSAIYLVPGELRSDLNYEGVPILEHKRLSRAVPAGHGQELSLVTRIDERDGSLIRAVLPVFAHSIAVHPAGGVALCNTQNGRTMASFDPETLEMGTLLTFEREIRGGGHSVFLPDGIHSAVTERQDYQRFTGRIEDHRGRLAIRDDRTLQLVESYDCRGIAPHDLNLLVDGKHVAIVNYGSTSWPTGQVGFQNYVVEPSVSVVELASGKVVHWYTPSSPRSEYRHIAAHDPSRIFVMQNDLVSLPAYHELMRDSGDLYRPILQKFPGVADTSLPIVRVDFTRGSSVTLLEDPDPRTMIRGQSITYDPEHDEVLATFPLSDSVLAFGAADGSVKRVVRTDRLGLRTPRGIALHPDGAHYAVAGNDENLFVFERGTHELVRSRCIYEQFFGHSHLTAAPAPQAG